MGMKTVLLQDIKTEFDYLAWLSGFMYNSVLWNKESRQNVQYSWQTNRSIHKMKVKKLFNNP